MPNKTRQTPTTTPSTPMLIYAVLLQGNLLSQIYAFFWYIFRSLNKYMAKKYQVWRAQEATNPREMFEPGEPKKPGQSIEVFEPWEVFEFGELKEPAERTWVLGHPSNLGSQGRRGTQGTWRLWSLGSLGNLGIGEPGELRNPRCLGSLGRLWSLGSWAAVAGLSQSRGAGGGEKITSYRVGQQ